MRRGTSADGKCPSARGTIGVPRGTIEGHSGTEGQSRDGKITRRDARGTT